VQFQLLHKCGFFTPFRMTALVREFIRQKDKKCRPLGPLKIQKRKSRIARAADAIRAANKVVTACHINPDGDTLGSALALAHALKRMGKSVTVLSHDGVPDIYSWMPGHDWVQKDTADRDFDLAIVCDTGTADRIGRARLAIESAPVSIDIDHHLAEGTFGQIRVVNAKVAATGELVFALLNELGTEIDKSIADCLMCAVVTDTGSFRYMNVTPGTFRIGGQLMKAGACPAAISELVFENRSMESIKLLGRALDSLRVTADGKVAWAHVQARDYEELSATDEETEGIVSHVRAVKGALVGILFREIPGKKVRISLRARHGYDVNRVANAFGGGGHKLAAGCSLDPPLENAESAVLAEVIRWL
jgi:phosphoesterase RecJ-like protein